MIDKDTNIAAGLGMPDVGARSFAIALLTIALVCLAVFPTLPELHQEWGSVNGHYSHGYLLLVLGIYFVWQKRSHLRLGSTSTVELWLFGIGFLGASLFWILGYLGLVVLIQYLALPALLASALGAVFGLRTLIVGLAPLFLVCFALPVWDLLNPSLQSLATIAVGKVMGVIGVPHYIDGHFVSLPNGKFAVEGGCSGLGFLLTSLSLAFVAMATAQMRWGQKLLLLGTAIAVALVVNWTRISIIIWQGYVTDMESSLIEDHLWLGWIIFSVLAFPLYWVFLSFVPEGVFPSKRTLNMKLGKGMASATFKGGCTLIFVLALFSARTVLDTQLNVQNEGAFEKGLAALIEDEFQICRGECGSGWLPEFNGADVEFYAEPLYRVNDDSDTRRTEGVTLYIASYLNEHQGKELIYYANRIAGSGKIESDISLKEGYRRLIFVTQGKSHVVIYWYDVNGVRYTNKRKVKLAQILAKLSGSHAGSVVAFHTICTFNKCGEDAARVLAYLESLNLPIRAPANQPSPHVRAADMRHDG